MPKTKKTFNVFLCGTTAKSSYYTGQEALAHGYPEGEIVAWLANHLQKNGQKEYIDYAIYNGVGSGNLDHYKYPVTPEEYSDIQGKSFGYGSDEILDAATTLIQGKVEPSRLMGMVSGKKTNVEREVSVPIENLDANAYKTYGLNAEELRQLQEIITAWENQEITTVNIVGWSRGGFNAIRLAHRLYKINPNIKVNILAFDPVPGPRYRSIETDTLPPNVENYVSYIALHEHTYLFTPLLPKVMDSETKVSIETFPGNHSGVVGGISAKGLTPEQQKPLTDIMRLNALRVLNKFNMQGLSSVHAEYENKNEKNLWHDIKQNNDAYTRLQDITITGVSNEYKKQELGKGKTIYHRLVFDGNSTTSNYLDEISGCQHNAPDPFDDEFEIQSDTCSVHRKYNDNIIASQMDAFLCKNFEVDDLNAYHIQRLADLRLYIDKRVAVANHDKDLEKTLEKVTAHTMKAISAYILKSKQRRESESGFEVDESLQQSVTKLDSAYLFLAAQLGNIDYIGIVASYVMDNDDDYQANDDAPFKDIFDIKNKKGMTPLMLAAQSGHLEAVTLLIKLKSSHDLTNTYEHEKTALDYAAENGHIEVAESLLESYPKTAQRAAKLHALIHAVRQKQTGIIYAWINDLHVEDLNELSSVETAMLLIWAIENKSKATITLLTTHMDKLYEDPFVQFVPKINEVIMWAAQHHRADIIDQSFTHWPTLYTNDKLAEHPEIATLLTWTIDNKKSAITRSIITKFPDLIQLSVNKQEETVLNRLAQKDFETFKIALQLRRAQNKGSQQVLNTLKRLPVKYKSLAPSHTRYYGARRVKIQNKRGHKYSAALVIAGSSSYLGLAIASAIPTIAAVMPTVLTGLLVSSFTFGIPIIAGVILALAVGAYVHYQPVKERSVLIHSVGKFLKKGVHDFKEFTHLKSTATKAPYRPSRKPTSANKPTLPKQSEEPSVDINNPDSDLLKHKK